MLEVLAEAIEEATIHPDRAQLVEWFSLIDRMRAKVSEVVAAFDDAQLWELDAATSMASWLRAEAGMSARSAVTMARTAAVLTDLPVTAAAWRDGTLSSDQVEAILANVPARHRARFASHEAAIIPALAPLDVAATSAAMRDWKARADAVDPGALPGEPERALHHSQTFGGRFETKGSFDTVTGALIATALQLATTGDAEGECRSATERRADALAEVCRWFLDHHRTATTRRNRPHLNLVIDIEDLADGQGAELMGFGPVDAAWFRTLVCDCGVHRILSAGKSTVLDYGRRVRTVPDHLFKLLALRDGGCRMPGCDRGPQWCDAHHVIPWEHGGETVLSNLVLKCSRHHHLGHRTGWAEKLDDDGTLTLTDPRGRVYESRPPGLLRFGGAQAA